MGKKVISWSVAVLVTIMLSPLMAQGPVDPRVSDTVVNVVVGQLSEQEKAEIFTARTLAWVGFYDNTPELLRDIIPAELTFISLAGWGDVASLPQAMASHAKTGMHLQRLEFSRTDMQRYGDVAICYSEYTIVFDKDGKQTTSKGVASEVFVRKAGRWIHPGWHVSQARTSSAPDTTN